MARERTAAQIEAEKKYRENHKVKRVPLDLFQPDYDNLRRAALDHGDGVNTYIKKAISAYSGQSFSWDQKENQIPGDNLDEV